MTLRWRAVTEVLRDFTPDAEGGGKWGDQCLSVKQGQTFYVVQNVDSDWSLVRTTSKPTQEGYLPSCILRDPRADHPWEVQVSPTASGTKPVMAQYNLLQQTDQENIPADGSEFIWAWHKTGGNDNWSHYSEDVWQAYPLEQARRLEDALLHPETDRSVQVDDERAVHFTTTSVIQARVDDPTRQRTVRRFSKQSLFQLDEHAPAGRIGVCTEWRKVDAGTYEGIVCGLKPGEKYTLCLRPAGPSASNEWSRRLEIATTKPVDRSVLDRSVREGIVLQNETEVAVDNDTKKKRWLRIRPDFAGVDAVDVFWQVRSKAPWIATAFVESSKRKREVSSAVSHDSEAPQLCGRICVNRGEIVRLEYADTGGTSSRAQMSWTLSPCADIVQSDPVEGRYLWVRHSGSIRLAEVAVVETSGERITPTGAAMSSSYCRKRVGRQTSDRSFPARNVLDGRLDTFCWTRSHSRGAPTHEWLCVDLGRPVTVAQIEIVNRLDSDSSSLIGASVCLTAVPNQEAEEVWKCTLRDDRPIYRCTFGASKSVTAAEPEPELFDSTQFDLDLHTYPIAEYEHIKNLVVELTGSEFGKAAQLPLPSRPIETADRNIDIRLPFGHGERVGQVRVERQFKSKAKPYQVKMTAVTDRDIAPIDLVVKDGDDLRQDQVVLVILSLFNEIWEREGVLHHPENGASLPVRAPTYKVATADTKAGFVEMLKDAKPVEDIGGKEKSLEGNGWRPSPQLLVSAVAAFVSGYFLRLRDRHQGNMVLCEGVHYANIDFGWMEESPTVDTGPFPVPNLLRAMLKSTGQWSEFCDLCWDALQVLRVNYEEIVECWKRHLVKTQPSLASPLYSVTYPGNWKERLKIDRRTVDEELDKEGWDDWLKNKTHAAGQKRGPSADDVPKPAETTTPTISTSADVDDRPRRPSIQDKVEMLQHHVEQLRSDMQEVKDDVAKMQEMMEALKLEMRSMLANASK